MLYIKLHQLKAISASKKDIYTKAKEAHKHYDNASVFVESEISLNLSLVETSRNVFCPKHLRVLLFL